MAASRWPSCRQICAWPPNPRTFRQRRSQAAPASGGVQPREGQVAEPAAPPAPGAPPNTTTVTIIDGKTGAKQEVVVPAPASGAAPAQAEPD